MDISYSCKIIITFRVMFKEEMLLTLLRRGEQLGFIYKESYSNDVNNSTGISLEEVLGYITMYTPINQGDTDRLKDLVVQYRETIFTLNIYKSDVLLSLNFFVLENPWKKICDSDEYIDFGRYVKLWIDMCEDFCIYKIETSID